MEIVVRAKEVYGNMVLYPANEVAEALAKIAGTKTLSREVIRIAREKLGMTHRVLGPEVML